MPTVQGSGLTIDFRKCRAVVSQEAAKGALFQAQGLWFSGGLVLSDSFFFPLFPPV